MAVRQAARTLRPGSHVELDVAPVESMQIVDAGDVSVTSYDIAEAPAYDHAEITSVAAATVVFDLVSLMVAGARTTAGASTNGQVATGVLPT